MIDFKLISIQPTYLNVKLKLQTIKEISMSDINTPFRFYLKQGNKYSLLDATVYYIKNLPLTSYYYEKVIQNNEELNFLIYNSDLFKGFNAQVVTISYYSNEVMWESERFFIKTKQPDTPLIDVTNHYYNGLISKLELQSELFEEHKSSIIIKQTIRIQGNEEYIVSDKYISSLANQEIIYKEFPRYGSYKIITELINLSNEVILKHTSYYVNLQEPLKVHYKKTTERGEGLKYINYRKVKPKRIFYVSGKERVEYTDENNQDKFKDIPILKQVHNLKVKL